MTLNTCTPLDALHTIYLELIRVGEDDPATAIPAVMRTLGSSFTPESIVNAAELVAGASYRVVCGRWAIGVDPSAEAASGDGAADRNVFHEVIKGEWVPPVMSTADGQTSGDMPDRMVFAACSALLLLSSGLIVDFVDDCEWEDANDPEPLMMATQLVLEELEDLPWGDQLAPWPQTETLKAGT